AGRPGRRAGRSGNRRDQADGGLHASACGGRLRRSHRRHRDADRRTPGLTRRLREIGNIMTEPNGMTAADIAMAEHMFGGERHDPDDEFAEDEQMFEGNVVLVDSRSLTDTSRTVVQKIRDELDAEVVVLPDPHTPKKRIKRSKAIVSDVGLKDIGDSIEPDSTVS